MKFEPGKTYLDRDGTPYVFSHKASGTSVTVFYSGWSKVCRNETGMYRWDGKEDSRDIVAEA